MHCNILIDIGKFFQCQSKYCADFCTYKFGQIIHLVNSAILLTKYWKYAQKVFFPTFVFLFTSTTQIIKTNMWQYQRYETV